MKAEEFIKQILSDHEEGRREYEEMKAENAERSKQLRASIAEKEERFAKNRAARKKHFDFIRR